MPKNKNINQDIDLKNYDNFDGPSLKDLDFGLWLSEKRKKIRKLIVVILILTSLGLFSYSVYSYIVYLRNSNNKTMISGSVPRSPRKIVSKLRIAPVQNFNNSQNNDLVVKLVNPNDKFIATFQYCFTQGKVNITCSKSYILPNQEKYILALAQNLQNNTRAVSFNISGISWKRIDAHRIPSWSNFYHNHLNFVISNLKLTNDGDNPGTKTLSFSIKNNTAYSYYQVPLNILFLNTGNLIGVNRYFLDNFLTGETRKVRISWKTSLSNVSQTNIEPDINLLDNSVYLPYQGN